MGCSQPRAAVVLLLVLAAVATVDETAFAQTAERSPKTNSSAHTVSRPARAASLGKSSASSNRASRLPVTTASANARLNTQLAPTAVQGMTIADAAEWVPSDQSVDFEVSSAQGNCCDAYGGEVYGCHPAGYLFDWTRADLWVGTVGFVVPGNFITTGSNSGGAVEGSFGFQEGVNFGSRMPSLLSGQMGAQLGLRCVQAQLDGSAAGSDRRQQLFATGGLFRRVDYGVQAGLAVDYLHDDWVYQADLVQLRGEVSYLLTPCHDLGFRFSDSQQTEAISARLAGNNTSNNLQLTALNTYRFFYRYSYGDCGRGQAELQAGWTEDSGTVLGIGLKTPLQNQLGLVTSATYLIPSQQVSPDFAAEGWNISLGVVWTPGRGFGESRDYYRPLFDVADNGSLITRSAPN